MRTPFGWVAALSLGIAVAAAGPVHAFDPSYAARVLTAAHADSSVHADSAAHADSTAHANSTAHAGSTGLADSTAHAAVQGVPAADSAALVIRAASSRSGTRRMQDTVSVLRGITVDDTRKPVGERSTITATRLDRATITRFLPST